LDAIFASVGYGDAVGVESRNGIIFIAPRAQPPLADIRVYDVRDLLGPISSYEAPRVLATGPIVTNQLFASPPNSPSTSMQDAIEDLIRAIEDSVDMDSLRDNGGNVGSIRELGGRLVIAQTPRAHSRIAQFLRALRAGGSKKGMRIQDAPQTE